MKASVSIQVRVHAKDAQGLKRAARRVGKKLAAFVRDAALRRAWDVNASPTTLRDDEDPTKIWAAARERMDRARQGLE